MNIEELTIKEAKEIAAIFGAATHVQQVGNPMRGRRCIVRTYSAGVHIGDVDWINPNNAGECKLSNSLRLWKWEGGGLSLSAVANDGINGGRLNKTGEIMLTNAIEYIPTTAKAEESYVKFVE